MKLIFEAGRRPSPKGWKENATARLDLRVHLIVSKLRLGASHMHAHTCTRTHARAFKATERSEVLTSRGAKRRVRYEKEKTNRAMRMHLRCIRLNLTSFGPLHGPLRSPAAGSLRSKKKKKTLVMCRAPEARWGSPKGDRAHRPQPPNPLPTGTCARMRLRVHVLAFWHDSVVI